jgi:hypothetical protein
VKTRHTALDGRVFEFAKHETTYHDFGSVTFVELHESTLPEAIIAQHREEVEDAYRVRGMDTAEEIAEALYLPLWNVRRALESLGVKLAPAPAKVSPTKAIRGRLLPLVLTAMQDATQPLRTPEVARLAGLCTASTAHVLRRHPELFRMVRTERHGSINVPYWALKEPA